MGKIITVTFKSDFFFPVEQLFPVKECLSFSLVTTQSLKILSPNSSYYCFPEIYFSKDFSISPGSTSGKEHNCQCRSRKRHRFDPWVGKIPWKRKWQPTQVFSPGESHGQRSLASYSPWGHKELDTTEAPQHTFPFYDSALEHWPRIVSTLPWYKTAPDTDNKEILLRILFFFPKISWTYWLINR